MIPSIDVLKAEAKAFRDRAAASGAPIRLCQAYEAIAHARGLRDWNTLRALAGRPLPAARPRPGTYLVLPTLPSPPWRRMAPRALQDALWAGGLSRVPLGTGQAAYWWLVPSCATAGATARDVAAGASFQVRHLDDDDIESPRWLRFESGPHVVVVATLDDEGTGHLDGVRLYASSPGAVEAFQALDCGAYVESQVEEQRERARHVQAGLLTGGHAEPYPGLDFVAVRNPFRDRQAPWPVGERGLAFRVSSVSPRDGTVAFSGGGRDYSASWDDFVAGFAEADEFGE